MSKVISFADAAALAKGAAQHFLEASQAAIANRGRFSVALSGGSTPKAMFGLLADGSAYPVDWARVFVFWGDERHVPPNHADSNYRMAHEALLSQVAIPEANVHRIPSELAPMDAANAYEATLKGFFADGEGFDLVLLGMGDDGHTASLFPHTAALTEQTRRVVANEVPQLDTWRITLTAPFINQARQVLFLVSGASKAPALNEVLHGAQQPQQYPSQMIAPVAGDLLWYVDDAALTLG